MRLTLGLEGEDGSVTEFALEEGALRLGRDAAAEVHVGRDDVSRRHAVVERTPEGFRLTDQGGANGTWLNGQPVPSAMLKDGDVFQLGPRGPRLRVQIEEPAVAPQAAAGAPVKRYGTAHLGLAALMLGAGSLLGFLVLVASAFELGFVPAVVAAGVAFAPMPVYLGLWLWLDRYDPEPAWVLAGCLAWGAGAATFASGIANDLFAGFVHAASGNRGLAQFLAASISAPLVEEASKGIAVLLILLFLRKEFDGVLDGIVYAGVVALGFAAVENVLYYGRSLVKGGTPALMIVFVLRGMLGPFAHAVFTAATGIGCGYARQTHNAAMRLLAPVLGFAGAVALHSLWNTMAGLAGPAGFLMLYALVWVPLFLVFLTLVLVMGHRESNLIRRQLEREIATGLVTAEDVARLGSWPRRMSWLMKALGNPDRLAARRQYLYAAARLALSYGHAERASVAGGHTQSLGQIPLFRREIERLRPLV